MTLGPGVRRETNKSQAESLQKFFLQNQLIAQVVLEIAEGYWTEPAFVLSTWPL